jgi:hypothetical protein
MRRGNSSPRNERYRGADRPFFLRLAQFVLPDISQVFSAALCSAIAMEGIQGVVEYPLPFDRLLLSR